MSVGGRWHIAQIRPGVALICSDMRRCAPVSPRCLVVPRRADCLVVVARRQGSQRVPCVGMPHVRQGCNGMMSVPLLERDVRPSGFGHTSLGPTLCQEW